MVKALLDAGADVNKAAANGRTPIYSALMNGYIEPLKLLLDAGAKFDMVDASGIRPLEVFGERLPRSVTVEMFDEVFKKVEINKSYETSDGKRETLLDYWQESSDVIRSMFETDPKGGEKIIAGKEIIVKLLEERGALLYEDLPMDEG